MKNFLLLVVLAFFLVSQFFIHFSHSIAIYPDYDECKADLPRNLRTTKSASKHPSLSSLNLYGLHHLKISGSGQFSEKAFSSMIHRLTISPENLVVLDLRQESHGFINGDPISWTDGGHNYANIRKTKSEIELDEHQRLRHAAHTKQIVVNPLDNPIKLTVHHAKTEKDLVESCGSTYIRLPVTDHNCPSHGVIDQFIELVKNLSPDQWIHMHCRAGKGRTTTFLILFDMMQNARYVSLKDILARQHLIGGIDLTQVEKKNNERTRAANERLEFIQNFYLYCQQTPHFQISWSDWIENKA